MNFRLFIKSFIYSISILIAITVLVFSSIKDVDIPDNSNNNSSDIQDTSTEKSIPESGMLSHYMLKLEEGTVNIYEVYSDQTKIKCGTLDIPTNTLREIDKLNFEHGIIVENENDILHITEDFTS